MPPNLRVILDTNVTVSGFISPAGPAGNILKALKEEKFTLLTSQSINEEILEVMNRPRIRDKYRLGEHLFDIAFILWEVAEIITDLPAVRILKDPDDNKFLSAAQGGLADYLVTGDIKELLHLQEHKSTRIVSPTEFLTILKTNYLSQVRFF